MMFLKPEERDSAGLTSKHDKGVFCNNFSIYIYIYIYYNFSHQHLVLSTVI